MAAESGIRIGDAEREKAATSLREHYAHGRLTLDEFQQRLDAVFAAKTAPDLARLMADLPHTEPYAAPWPPSQPFGTPPPGYPTGGGWGPGAGRGWGPGAGWGRGRRPMSYVGVCLAFCVLAVLLISSFSWPFAAPRFLIILIAILAIFRRIFRRIGGRRR